jgi:P-type E1-E2 ATPase
MFDKTGTLTYGRPRLMEIVPAAGFFGTDILTLAASLERYSRHPLAAAVLEEAKKIPTPLPEAEEVSERPGEGLRGVLDGQAVQITSRQKLAGQQPEVRIPESTGGMEAVVVIAGIYAGLFRFRDEPREEGKLFVRHLTRRHGFRRVMLVSGDRESEVRYLADRVGIKEVYAEQSPEQKLALVRQETARADTLFVGDGINDAPALTAATVGVAFGQADDITTEAAGAVVLDSSLEKVDELLHIGKRMRSIALQSAVGGMALSFIGMLAAAGGYLEPVAGAVAQEAIDVLAVVNALRVAIQPRVLTDY